MGPMLARLFGYDGSHRQGRRIRADPIVLRKGIFKIFSEFCLSREQFW